jgi:hypothetical protein
MPLSVRIPIFVLGLFLFIMILELVRNRRLREELSIIWLLAGIASVLSSFADLIVDPLAFKLHISYPPTLVFMLIFFLFVIVMLYFSIVVSDLKSTNKELCQKIAMMEYKLGKLQR